MVAFLRSPDLIEVVLDITTSVYRIMVVLERMIRTRHP